MGYYLPEMTPASYVQGSNQSLLCRTPGTWSLCPCPTIFRVVKLKLRHLQMMNYHRLMADMNGFHKGLGPLVGVVEAGKPNRFLQRVGLVSMHELGMN